MKIEEGRMKNEDRIMNIEPWNAILTGACCVASFAKKMVSLVFFGIETAVHIAIDPDPDFDLDYPNDEICEKRIAGER